MCLKRRSGRPCERDSLREARVDDRFDAIVDASAALTATPSAFGPAHVDRLRAAGIDDAGIADQIAGAAFFNWANRLMLSLGEPEVV